MNKEYTPYDNETGVPAYWSYYDKAEFDADTKDLTLITEEVDDELITHTADNDAWFNISQGYGEVY